MSDQLAVLVVGAGALALVAFFFLALRAKRRRDRAADEGGVTRAAGAEAEELPEEAPEAEEAEEEDQPVRPSAFAKTFPQAGHDHSGRAAAAAVEA